MTAPASPPSDGPELDLELPAKPAFVRTARHAVAALARMHDLPDDVIEDVRIAVSEACTAVLPAADDPDEAIPIRLSASAEATRMVIELIDPYSRLEREVAGAPAELDTADLPFDRALSLPIIRGLVDEMAISPRQGHGVVIRMTLLTEEADTES